MNLKEIIMEKEFIPYEQALALKELGFDEPCFAKYFQQDGNTPFIQIGESEIEEAESADDVTFECDTPTFFQVFRFFREKYELDSHIKKGKHGDYILVITDHLEDSWDEHEQAELECLKRLIEIVKNDKNLQS
jgi:hypothetical protein